MPAVTFDLTSPRIAPVGRTPGATSSPEAPCATERVAAEAPSSAAQGQPLVVAATTRLPDPEQALGRAMRRPRPNATVYLTRDTDDGETEITVSCRVSRYVLARTSGPAELCHPAEGGDVEVLDARDERGAVVTLTADELARVTEQAIDIAAEAERDAAEEAAERRAEMRAEMRGGW